MRTHCEPCPGKIKTTGGGERDRGGARTVGASEAASAAELEPDAPEAALVTDDDDSERRSGEVEARTMSAAAASRALMAA
eukprot:scaffold211702_cov27-Tisochrysis_lutea.AAC.9